MPRAKTATKAGGVAVAIAAAHPIAQNANGGDAIVSSTTSGTLNGNGLAAADDVIVTPPKRGGRGKKSEEIAAKPAKKHAAATAIAGGVRGGKRAAKTDASLVEPEPVPAVKKGGAKKAKVSEAVAEPVAKPKGRAGKKAQEHQENGQLELEEVAADTKQPEPKAAKGRKKKETTAVAAVVVPPAAPVPVVEKAARGKRGAAKQEVNTNGDGTPIQDDIAAEPSTSVVALKQQTKAEKKKEKAVKKPKNEKQPSKEDAEEEKTNNEAVELEPITAKKRAKGAKIEKTSAEQAGDDNVAALESPKKKAKKEKAEAKPKSPPLEKKKRNAKEVGVEPETPAKEQTKPLAKDANTTDAKGANARGRGRKRTATVAEVAQTEAMGSKSAKTKKTGGELLNPTITSYSKADFVLAAPHNLKISSWNVAGLRSWLKKDGLKFLQYEEPDIFCIQETKCANDQLPDEALRIVGYHPYWLCMPGGYAGVAIYSKIMPINVEYGIGNAEFDAAGRIITAEYEKFFLVNVYVPNAGRKLVNLEPRMRWEQLFQAHIKRLDARKAVIICGDMNVSHHEIDLANPKTNTRSAGFTKEERDKMSELLALGFVDTFRQLYPKRTGAYSYWTYLANARSRNVGWRLDYFIVSQRWAGRVVENCMRTQCMGSDHCPITLFMQI